MGSLGRTHLISYRGYLPIWKSWAERVYKGSRENCFPFLDPGEGIRRKECKPLNSTLPAMAVNMAISLGQK